jgi:glucosamine 6-phosphate synthetase-like amidotransferase/phosphosugar isomerase protein
MCGIVCFFGQAEGVPRVLEALHLLEYRAPDSAGLAAITESGQLAVRRSVGTPKCLVAKMAADPLYAIKTGNPQGIAELLAKQGLNLDPESLRDCSSARGYTLENLYCPNGLRVGIGDRGTLEFSRLADPKSQFSTQMYQTLQAAGALSSPDYDPDPVCHAFRLVAAHIASRVDFTPTLRQDLDNALLARVPTGAYANWYEAWADEVAVNTPGQAFAVAVRNFQETFPDLAEHLNEDDWERVGGLTALAMTHIVLGHGRWAMVGAVTETNAHPFLDRSRTRVICENGSHNVSLVLGVRADQEAWWRARGLPQDQPVHRSENTTEVIVYEWERAFHQLEENDLDPPSSQFLNRLDEHKIYDLEERALRLALWRLRTGNAHACTFYSRRQPGVLYVSSHHKPIAIAIRTIETEPVSHIPGAEGVRSSHLTPGGSVIRPEQKTSPAETGKTRYELMVASDVNAALMLWPGHEVEAAATRIQALRTATDGGTIEESKARREIQAILDRFTVDVIFLDMCLYQGQELLARISNRIEGGQVIPEIQVSRYDGTPGTVMPQSVRLNPAMVEKRGYPSYTESHIAEIPDVMDDIVKTYIHEGEVRLESVCGLNSNNVCKHYGSNLERLSRLLLIGEGSSWRDAQAAAPLFRELLPDVVVNVYRPVEVLNLGKVIYPSSDLAIEISWSGTTDSLLKVDNWLAEMGVVRLTVTGQPQSDLGRRTASSAGTLDVRTGVEVSVATIKGYQAILMTLYLLALQLADMRAGTSQVATSARLIGELTSVIPQHVRAVINDQARRKRTRSIAKRCRHFNKVAIVGDSPVDIEAELKIEELAQIVATTFDFHSTSLRSLIERSALVDDDRARTLFIINATTLKACHEAGPIISYLRGLGVFCIIHTIPHEQVEVWEAMPNTRVFVSPQVSERLQPLIDAPFFFDLAVALAYARGLPPEDVDRPRNLSKSVTTTGAERRVEAEARQELHNVTLTEFVSRRPTKVAWDASYAEPSHAALRATIALQAAISVTSEPLPKLLDLDHLEHLIAVTDTEATENAVHMAAAAWQDLLGIELAVYRHFIPSTGSEHLSDLPQARPGTALLRLIRAGVVPAVRDAHTIALPIDMSPLQLEMLGAVYLTGLAVRLARQRGVDTSLWESSLARLPSLITEVLSDTHLSQEVNAFLSPFVRAGYDKLQIVGGGQDFAAAASIARSLRMHGFMAEALYTDSAWHGPLATVGGPDAEHDTLIIILATDPLYQAASLVDTQVYRTRNAPVLLVVPEGNQDTPTVRGVDPSGTIAVPTVPRLFVPMVNAALGAVLAQQMSRLWEI